VNLISLKVKPIISENNPGPCFFINRQIHNNKISGWVFVILLSIQSFSPCSGMQELTPETLISGNVKLTVNRESIRLSFKFPGDSPVEFRVTDPLELNLLDNSDVETWLKGKYTSISRSGNFLVCSGEVLSISGSAFRFIDTYSSTTTGSSFILSREVNVISSSPNDVGFLSRFSLHSSSGLGDQECFIPGIWYKDNSQARQGALATNLTDNYFIIREDRMPLPMVIMRNRNNGSTITLVHYQPDGSTCMADNSAGRVIDDRIHVASLGIQSKDNAAVCLYYPATEGERTYFRGQGSNRDARQWVERFHPVRSGFHHSYKVLINISEHPDFPQAMRYAWRTAFENIHPPVANTDIRASYEASISLIADWSKSTKGAPGIPFRLQLPEGRLEDAEKINYQMGFVGQQLPLAYHLLRYGLLNKNEEIKSKGEAMVDFWAANSLTAEGLPRTWYNTYPEPHWRAYNTFMRVASDGMMGALMAWDVMQKYGHPKPEWIKFCTGFGDWLVQHQNIDGSWYREYKWDSTPANEGKQNTTHPIRFMVDLSKATGNKKYLEAALKAGEYCWRTVHKTFSYVGGTADNPNVIDKEAGFIAMDAFLALWDITGEKRWLDAASQAGDFTETWAYCWNLPIPEEDTTATFPEGATTTGFSLIATGHSGADLFLAGAPFLYYRIYLGTGDEHYADIARQLLYDTKQGMDINGSLGYGHTGLCTEALSLCMGGRGRGHGVNTWLPWLTYSMIEPIVRLDEAYGLMDTPTVTGKKLRELRRKDNEYAQSRGLYSSTHKNEMF
jgi:hypothetical protein